MKYQTIYLQTRLKRSDHFRRTDIYKLTFERSFWSSGSGRPIQRFRSFLITTTKFKNVKEYFVFREEWYELRKSLSKNAWYELETLMLQLRFDGVDTDPKTIKSKTVRTLWVSVRQRILDSMENCERKKRQRAKVSLQDNDFQKSDFKAQISHVNDTDDTNYQNTIESVSEVKEMGNTGILQDTELIGTLKIEQFEAMKGKTTIEIEEQDLTNDEIVKRASNDFVNHYKIDAYNLWVEMNDRNRNGESYQILWKKWIDMWRPYICTDRRIELQAEITSAVVKRYGKRYFKELKERQNDTITVTKSNADPQNEVLNDDYDNYSEDLNEVLDENSKVINNAVTRIARAQMFQSKESEYIIDQAIKKIDSICATLKDDKDKLDFERYINERMASITA